VPRSQSVSVLNMELDVKSPLMAESLRTTGAPTSDDKRKLTRSLWIDYFAGERLRLNERIVADGLQELRAALPGWLRLLGACFLSDGQKRLYRDLLAQRGQLLGL